jgi:hypothetical protein
MSIRQRIRRSYEHRNVDGGDRCCAIALGQFALAMRAKL